MQKVYSARDAMEAHIIRGMLAQHGIVARVNGEFLQGGIGELPLVDLITVTVADEDYTAAKQVIDEYDRA